MLTFVTRSDSSLDPAYAVPNIGANGVETIYPSIATNGNGLSATIGWETNTGSVGSADRNNSINPVLAGLNFIGAFTSATWRMNLPAPGTYRIVLGYR